MHEGAVQLHEDGCRNSRLGLGCRVSCRNPAPGAALTQHEVWQLRLRLDPCRCRCVTAIGSQSGRLTVSVCYILAPLKEGCR
jgi:hypothetical protein